MATQYESWGRYPRTSQSVTTINWRTDSLPNQKNILPYGLGKSYGDACLNDGGTLLDTKNLNHFIDFNPDTGLITCEAGVTLADILQLTVPHGWFLPVTPGLKYITVGGAIGNDVHGKNHVGSGSFGHHLTQFELLRSDNSRLICSPTQNSELFTATIGGLGLTGLITWAQFQLKKITNVLIDSEQVITRNLDEVMELFAASKDTHEYTIASIDSSAAGNHIGCGYFLRGNHATATPPNVSDAFREPKISIPAPLPISALNSLTIALFNALYYHRQAKKSVRGPQHYDPFFYPQDIIAHWNYFYGPNGFIQYQCQLPPDTASKTLRELFLSLKKSGFASPLTTLKMLGPKTSLGLLSFPREGFTLALDFPNTGEALLKQLDYLDSIVQAAGGRIYPAKDARMSPAMFQSSYPQWQQFEQHIDPAFSSSLWRRVTKVR